ncbi:MAG: hypothetical protein HY901_13290 [Deltaproteobacteria bacterium]|nr:hypothetical protein [Deltaproteobacteria bacterium]
MPTPELILRSLTGIANDWLWLAVAWHVFFAAVLAAVFSLKPQCRVVGLLLALPPVCVSALAWMNANPFNGSTFAALALALAILAIKLPKEPIARGPAWTTVAGALMFAFGWAYPHFLEGQSPVAYLYGAPTGLIPCPTLSAIIGVALILGGVGGKAWPRVLAATGLFYGVFGTLRLGVTLDWALVAGAAALLAATFATASNEPPARA